jgi:peptide/nickel transport system permease protein
LLRKPTGMSVGSAQLLLDVDLQPPGRVAGATPPGRSPLRLAWRRFRRDRAALASLAIVVLLLLLAIFAPLIADAVGAAGPDVRSSGALSSFGTPTGPSSGALWPFIALLAGAVLAVIAAGLPGVALRRRGSRAVIGVAVITAVVLAVVLWPSARHLFGVDPQGRDIFARVIYGGRSSLLAAVAATALSLLVGGGLGLLAGYRGGVVDVAVSRLLDVLLPFPVLLLAVGVAAACTLGHGCVGGLITPGVPTLIVAVAFAGSAYVARFVRAQVAAMRGREFVVAARSLGASRMRILVKEILPNLIAPMLIAATVLLPQAVLCDAALSFLGAGARAATPSWGTMLKDATADFSSAWWYVLFPGAALLITVLALTVVGDGVRCALRADPHD